MRHVRPAVDETDAVRRLRGGIFKRLFQPFDPVKSELLWLPVWLVPIEVHLRGRTSIMNCSVDALSGSFALVELSDAFQDGEPEGERLDPVLDGPAAEKLARSSLVTYILRRRSQSGKPIPGDTQSVEPLRWPYWVVYHRRGKLLDIKLLDAATGRSAGGKLKLAVLDAFRDLDSQSSPEKEP